MNSAALVGTVYPSALMTRPGLRVEGFEEAAIAHERNSLQFGLPARALVPSQTSQAQTKHLQSHPSRLFCSLVPRVFRLPRLPTCEELSHARKQGTINKNDRISQDVHGFVFEVCPGRYTLESQRLLRH